VPRRPARAPLLAVTRALGVGVQTPGGENRWGRPDAAAYDRTHG
jgi:hypothetical protein